MIVVEVQPDVVRLIAAMHVVGIQYVVERHLLGRLDEVRMPLSCFFDDAHQ